MTPELFLTISCLVIVITSTTGGMLLAALRITHTQLQLMVSMIAGLMLGVALLHLLPMSVEILPQPHWAFFTALLGLLVMFFLIRAFHFHQHATLEADVESEPAGADRDEACQHDHGHTHGHTHEHAPRSTENHQHAHKSSAASWLGLVIGLSIHSLLDGFALAAAVNAESGGFYLGALGIMLAIALHKPLDNMMVTSMMIARGSSRNSMFVFNLLYALTCPLGALLLWLGIAQASELQHWILGLALAFSAGVFLCISLGDLLPELHFHTHDRFKLSAALLAGVAIALGIEFLPGHSHHGADAGHERHEHEKHEHDE